MPPASRAPARLGGFKLDVGTGEADVAEQPIVHFAKPAALPRPLLPVEQ
jgi:hypothetical protein